MDPKPLPPLEHPDDPKTPAKELFGRKTEPAKMAARSIGYYTHGCLAGGVALPINGPTWQVMRLSRNRNWGHPTMIKTLEHLAEESAVDRLARLPGRRHGAAARRPDDHRALEPSGRARCRRLADADAGPRADAPGARGDVGDQCRQRQMERRAAGRLVGRNTSRSTRCWRRSRGVERVLANPAIKKALCRDVKGDRSWLHKIRPVVGHNYHFHLRIVCPADSPDCKAQPVPPTDEGCGKDLDCVVHQAARRSRSRAVRAEADPDVGAAGGVQADIDGEVAAAQTRSERARKLPHRKRDDQHADREHQRPRRDDALPPSLRTARRTGRRGQAARAAATANCRAR